MTTRTQHSVLKATLSTWRSALNHRDKGKRTPERAFMWKSIKTRANFDVSHQYISSEFSINAPSIFSHAYVRIHLRSCPPGDGWRAGVSADRPQESHSEKHALLLLQWMGGFVVERLGFSVREQHGERSNEYHQLFWLLVHKRCELCPRPGFDSRIYERYFIRQDINSLQPL